MAHDYVFGFWNDRTKAQVHPADDVYTKDQADYIFATYSVVDARYTPLYSHNHSYCDTAPTSNSTKPVTSGGIKSALDALDAAIDARLDALEELVPSPAEGDEPLSDWIIEEGSMTTAHSDAVDDDDHYAETHWNNKNVTWHYQKWNSGKLEVWATQIDTWAIVHEEANGLYRGSFLARQQFPYTGTAENTQYMFVERPDICDIKVIGQNAYTWVCYGNKNKYDRSSTPGFFPFCNGGPWNTEPIYIEYHAIGRWK